MPMLTMYIGGYFNKIDRTQNIKPNYIVGLFLFKIFIGVTEFRLKKNEKIKKANRNGWL